MRMRDVKSILYPKWDSNPHIFRYCILSATRLPIPPFGLDTWSILHEFSELPNDTAYCGDVVYRSEEHTSELQSRFDLVCRLLLEKKKIDVYEITIDS